MGIFDVGEAVGKIGSSVIEAGADLLSEFIEDKDERNRIAHEIATMGAKQQHDKDLAQLEINKIEAQHASVFVSGGRPAAIWVGVIGLAQIVVIFPLIVVLHSLFDGVPGVSIPSVDTALLFAVLGPLLGLGAYRTAEKFGNVARSNLKE